MTETTSPTRDIKAEVREKKEAYAAKKQGNQTNVIIKGIDIPFGDLVMLMIKVAFAAIPAGIIVSIVYLVMFAVLGGMFR